MEPTSSMSGVRKTFWASVRRMWGGCSRPLPCRVAAEHGRGRLELELLEPVDGAAPGQTACLLRGDVVVGWGTICR